MILDFVTSDFKILFLLCHFYERCNLKGRNTFPQACLRVLLFTVYNSGFLINHHTVRASCLRKASVGGRLTTKSLKQARSARAACVAWECHFNAATLAPIGIKEVTYVLYT